MSDQTTPALDRPGVLSALQAMRAEAHRLEQPGEGYPAVSVRGLAFSLGFGDVFEDILEACVDGGFTNCLDCTVEFTSFDPNGPDAVNGMTTGKPAQWACEWGPDQLRSRLDCVDYRVSRGSVR